MLAYPVVGNNSAQVQNKPTRHVHPKYIRYSYENQVPNANNQTPNLAVRKMVHSLKCFCPLSERGCTWLGNLGSCEDHLVTCGYVRDQCRLRCGVVLQRNKLKIHEEEKCPQRNVRCKHCRKGFKSCELPRHIGVCRKMKVTCELKCDRVICREDMEYHLQNECVERRIECPFAKYNCEEPIKRKDLDKHLEEKETTHLGLKLNATEMKLRATERKLDVTEKVVKEQKLINEEQKTEMLEQIEHVVEEVKHLGLKHIAMEMKLRATELKLDVTDKVAKEQKQINEEQKTEMLERIEHVETKLCVIANMTQLHWRIDKMLHLQYSASRIYHCGRQSYYTQFQQDAIYLIFLRIDNYCGLTGFEQIHPFKAKFVFRVTLPTTPCTLIEYRGEMVKVGPRNVRKGCIRKIVRFTRDERINLSRIVYGTDGGTKPVEIEIFVIAL